MISGPDSVSINKGGKGESGQDADEAPFFLGLVIYEVLPQRGYDNCVLCIK